MGLSIMNHTQKSRWIGSTFLQVDWWWKTFFLAVMKVCNKLELHRRRYVRNGTRDTHLSKSNRSSFQLLIAQTCNARPLRSYWFGSAAV